MMASFISKYVYLYPNKQSHGRHVNTVTGHSHCGSYIVSYTIPIAIVCRVTFDMLKSIMGGL